MKIEALKEGEDLSEITERLYLEFLRRKKVRIPKSRTTAVGKLSKTDPSERKIGFLAKKQSGVVIVEPVCDLLNGNGH